VKQIALTFMALSFPVLLFAQDIFDIAANGSPAEVRAALAAVADVNARDARGETALMRAASFSNSPQVIAVLVKAGARVQERNRHGDTAVKNPPRRVGRGNFTPSLSRNRT